MTQPQMSERAQTFPASPIRRLVPLSEKAEARGVRVYRVNIGQPDIPTPESVLAAIRGFSRNVISYSNSQGEALLIDAWRRYYGRLGFPLDRSEVMATTGGSEAILFAFQVIGAPGDEILVPEPFYTNYQGFALMAGLRIVPIPTAIEQDFDLPSDAALETMITPRTRAILLCNPSNPTGKVYDRAQLERVGRLAVKHGLFILSDEVYREFLYGEATHHSFLSFPEFADHVIVVDSASKRFSACGTRVGCMVTRRKDVVTASIRYGQARLSSPQVDQLAVAAALDLPDSYYAELLAEYEARRNAAFEGLRKIPGVHYGLPAGAFYMMVSLPVPDADVFAQWLLTDFQYEGETVMVAPGNGFYATPGAGLREIRIAFVLDSARLSRAMEILGKALEAYPLTFR